MKGEIGKKLLTNYRKIENGVERFEDLIPKDWNPITMNEGLGMLYQWKENGSYFESGGNWVIGFDKFNRKKVGDMIMSCHDFITTRDNEELFWYTSGTYLPEAESVVKETTNLILGQEGTSHRQNEVIDYIKVNNYTNRSKMNPKFLINLQNGIYDLESADFSSHSPDIIFTNQLPIKYDGTADCPKIKEFCSQIVREEDVPLLQELIGYCLYKGYPIQKAFMLVGGGANGKSTFINLLKRFLGSNNVSSISLQDINRRRFAVASLYGKLANLYADLSDSSLHKTGKFKMLTGEDSITADKKWKSPFDFVNYAKLVFSTNKVPECHDDTDAFFRRWIIINFPNKFEGEDADPNILKKITTEKELSGMFNWALKGLDRLLENGRFTNTPSTQEMRDRYERLSSSVGAFAQDCLEVSSSSDIPKDNLFLEYVAFCEENGLPAKAKNIFARDLPRFIPVESQRLTVDGQRTQCWVGIKLKKDNELIY